MSQDEHDAPSAPTEDLSAGLLRPGEILGERYRIGEQLGRGGMGEVWRAFDLKLRVEVALKAMREDLYRDEKSRDLLRREVRAAREVISPNVCRIFDLIEADGRELVSMEFVDGGTLLDVLRERGPLDLKEAQDIASQFLAGLEAIHKAGLIHRDVKPENIMLTRAGRVVLMDFGLARQEDSGAGTVAGTPAYMAPEQAAGLLVDARADVYSAGVVLAEMVSPEGIKDLTSRQSVWEGIRHEPTQVPDSPWAPVLKKAVAKQPEERYKSAHTLTRALEDVTLRVEGAEDLNPYPGLASFTESDAEFFFGREAEIEALWRSMEGPPRLLAIAGPSGAGKTSFLRAGVVPNASADWTIVRCTPGDDPVNALAGALAPGIAGDAEAVRRLLKFHEPDTAVELVAAWRRHYDSALIIVDQFEELFTLNPPEVQHAFATLLARLVLEANVFVLLSLRDDFLFGCHQAEALRPVLSDLTMVGPPVGGPLRRALVQPATRCGYRFEDDELVEEMLAEVEGERGALPLLAFAMSRMWEARDRENGLITRQIFRDIGGVAGALAQHAESTVERIGGNRQTIVREVFRNLVTAEGTRAVRTWGDLISVFEEGKRQQAEPVLHALIDARLLTSYEVHDEGREPTRRVEIIHESLLANWPRLARWQTQDTDAAQLRDQLRQAARTWDERDRSDDLLWTGSAFREFSIWRERYPGGLSDLEQAFAAAMTRHAGRRQRRRRMAVAATFLLLLAVLVVVGLFWRQSEDARRHAEAETLRAEANSLVALAQLQLETDPTEALAHATASLELADTPSARSFVMRALWEAPPARVLETNNTRLRFSPDGGWIVSVGGPLASVWSSTGEGPIELSGLDMSTNCGNDARWVSEDLLVTALYRGCNPERARLWSMPEGRLLRTIDFGGPSWWQVGGHHLFTEATDPGDEASLLLRSWRLPDGELQELGRVATATRPRLSRFDPSGNAWIHTDDRTIFSRPLPLTGGGRDRVLGTHNADIVSLMTEAPYDDRLVSIDRSGEYRLWSLSRPVAGPLRVIPQPESAAARDVFPIPDPAVRWLYPFLASRIGMGLLWDVTALPGAQPIELRRSGSWIYSHFTFHPRGDWLAVTNREGAQTSFWPLHKAYRSVVEGATSQRKGLAFSPDARFLAVTWITGPARLFQLQGTSQEKTPSPAEHSISTVPVFDPTGSHLSGGAYGNFLSVVPLDGGAPHRLEGFQEKTLIESVAFSPSGQLVAAASGISLDEKMLRVWNLDTGEVQAIDLRASQTSAPVQPVNPNDVFTDNVQNLWFTDEETLFTVGATAFLRWDLETGANEEVVALGAVAYRSAAASADGHKVLIVETAELTGPGDLCDTPELYDLAADTSQELPAFGTCVRVIALDPTGNVAATGDAHGVVRVGRIAEGEPHLLAGHDGAIEYVAISPDLRWVASVGSDSTVRLWPMPDLDKPPLHTLPRAALIAKLKTLTNLRVVRDPSSTTGWTVEVGPFPGWETVPSW